MTAHPELVAHVLRPALSDFITSETLEGLEEFTSRREIPSRQHPNPPPATWCAVPNKASLLPMLPPIIKRDNTGAE